MIPSLFISHGSPMLALEDAPTSRFLHTLAETTPKPDAIIIASAHWETDIPMLTGAETLETIHDFNGFPAELYKLHYPAHGHRTLVSHIVDVLSDAEFEVGIDNSRGLDHGAWNPLMLMYPLADVPVVQISVQPKKDAKWHYEIGRKLARFRSSNILVLGSGNLTHNLYEAFRGKHKQPPHWVLEFAEWIADKIAQGDLDSLLAWEKYAPYALKNHPTPEHFLPFFVALGAGNFPAKRMNDYVEMGVLAMDIYTFA